MSVEQANIYDIKVKDIKGQEKTLADYKGDVFLIVNVASKCGLTPQYEALEKIYEQYEAKGFEILGFPANNFAGQEPGTDDEIQEFCSVNYNVKFPLFSKISVKGEDKHPLYTYLTSVQPTASGSDGSFEQRLDSKGLLAGRQPGDITWNFEKFLVNREGDVVARFSPDVLPTSPVITEAIEAELAK